VKFLPLSPLLFLSLSVALSLPLSLPLPLSAQDTTSTKQSLLAADRSLATDLAVQGAAAFFDHLAPDAAVLIPDAPIYTSAVQARAPWLKRYAHRGWRFVQEAQHAVAARDGNFGCTVGLTRLEVATDANKVPRYGRYIACWQRASADASWKVVGYTRTNDAPNEPALGDDLHHPPHSATPRAAASGAARSAAEELKDAQDADSAFAAVSLARGPGAAFGEWAAADAMLLGAAPKPRQGPAAMRDAFKNFPRDGTFHWAPVRSLGAAGDGLAFTSGDAFNIVGGKRSQSKYITVWRREADGRWRFIFDSGSGRP